MSIEQTLKDVSEIYWDEPLVGESLQDQMQRYICQPRPDLENRCLLQAELDWARKHDQIQAQLHETLVLLVGFSPEPLLQSICVYRPKKVIFILNQWYGEEEGQVFAERLQEGVKYLEQQGLIDVLPEVIDDPGCVLPRDDPTSVFRTLNEALSDVCDAVIDITGGKKSMVASAFLYAAYAGIPISYVDFDEYHPEKRRPYGYSCGIGEITNPYQDFALREWERVRDLYTDYKFREARKTLKMMWPQVKGYFSDDAGASVETMLTVFGCYEAWDAGDYNRAYVEAQKMPSFAPPDAVEMWGRNDEWVKTSGVEFIPAPRFYEDTDRFRAYIRDELARIQRLIKYNEDYISAFLRAGGLNEAVMVARLVRLVSNVNDKNALLTTLEQATPRARNLFLALLNLDKNLNPKKQSEINLKKFYFPGVKNPPQFTIQNTTPMSAWWIGTSTLFDVNNGWDIFLKRRNDLTHQYFSPPLEWAEDALAFVEANVEDFFGQPIEDLNFDTEHILWSELCELSGMRRYLPQSLRKEAER